MTPSEAAKFLERLPASFLKLELIKLLEWQATRGKALMHMGWYLRCLKYRDQPRLPVAGAEGRARVKSLTHTIGGPHDP